MNRRHQSVTLEEASLTSPILARLAQLGRESTRRLDAVKPLLPEAIRPSVKAGPIDNSVWCLLADNAAVAAKLRQLLPHMQAQLSARGMEVTSIRIRVAGSR
jgi:hypothetical protein